MESPKTVPHKRKGSLGLDKMGRFEDEEGKLVSIELKGHTSVVGSALIDEASTPLDKHHT